MHKDATSLLKAKESNWSDIKGYRRFGTLHIGYGLEARVNIQVRHPRGDNSVPDVVKSQLNVFPIHEESQNSAWQ
ncbi:hypothetical protein EVAR_65318_1 [Eumeta japonica]|uniref:Uncharacterized protein n=1 Tax=Eumeta variegata TaxID=151549 RepID=A0A4C1YRQ8_EUMVA|nr:hypothetical protein EVAR_65318_1 [Eumeta japonica]